MQFIINSNEEEDKIFTPQVVAGHYKYWYQEQERQTDLDLNWDSFKYRNYDYAIGRFMSVDPLAEKYPYNGMYNFSENRVIDGRELEGLEYISVENTGLSPQSISNAKNEDGTYNIKLGDLSFNNVSMVNYNGKKYFNLGQHVYYGESGWSLSGNENDKISEWVYTDIQLFNQDIHHTYTWGDPTLTGTDAWGNPKNLNCASLAVAQAEEIGTNVAGGMVRRDKALNEYRNGVLYPLNTSKGIDYINTQLESGNVVVIGVDDGANGGTDNLGTDHYIVISGRTSVNGQGRFLFLENAVGNEDHARDFNANRLTPHRTRITGISPHWYNAYYTVTRIQQNE